MGGHMVDMDSADPIFIHGVLPRSGTNFLWDLLLLHPDCARAQEPVKEDLFLDRSDHLVRFVDAVRARWDPRWGTFAAELPDRLYRSIGDGLVSFLWTDRQRRLVTKSPSVVHLELFFAFFPCARLLILVRDGRSVVQSAWIRSAGTSTVPAVRGRRLRTRFIVFSRPNPLVRTAGALCGTRISWTTRNGSCARCSSFWGSIRCDTISRLRATSRFGDLRHSVATRQSALESRGEGCVVRAEGTVALLAHRPVWTLRLARRRTTRCSRLCSLAASVQHRQLDQTHAARLAMACNENGTQDSLLHEDASGAA